MPLRSPRRTIVAHPTLAKGRTSPKLLPSSGADTKRRRRTTASQLAYLFQGKRREGFVFPVKEVGWSVGFSVRRRASSSLLPPCATRCSSRRFRFFLFGLEYLPSLWGASWRRCGAWWTPLVRSPGEISPSRSRDETSRNEIDVVLGLLRESPNPIGSGGKNARSAPSLRRARGGHGSHRADVEGSIAGALDAAQEMVGTVSSISSAADVTRPAWTR